jgi:hypothetical protein
MAARRRIGAQGDETEDIIKYGLVLGALGLFVIKPLLNTLGVSSADSDTVAAQNTVTPASNPFSYQFQPFIDLYYPGGNTASEQSDMQNGLQEYQQQGVVSTQVPPDYQLIEWAEAINSAFGYIGYDADTVLSIFNSLGAQTDVAYMAAYLYWNYGKDLMTLLTNGRYAPIFGLTSGLSKTDLALIINHVKSLPVSGS